MTSSGFHWPSLLDEHVQSEPFSRGSGYSTSAHAARADVPEGYELEVFAATGQTIVVVSVPASAIREARENEVLSVRELGQS